MQYVFVGMALLSAYGVLSASSMRDAGNARVRENGAFLFGVMLVMFVVGVSGCVATAE